MQRWMSKLQPLASGAVTLGVFQAVQSIDLNQLWFQFWLTLLNALIALLLGGDLSLLSTEGTGSPFGGFFL